MKTLINNIKLRYQKEATKDSNLSCGNPVEYAEFKTAMTCVDLGCGKGKHCFEIAKKIGKGGKVFGIDITDEMIEIAKEIAKTNKIKNVYFIKANFEDIPLEANTVDYVFSSCAINHSLNKKKVFEEIYRILKPSGKALISDIYSLEKIPEKYSKNPKFIAECWAGAVLRDEYIDIVKSAGFSELEILNESSPYNKNGILLKSFTFKIEKPHYSQ